MESLAAVTELIAWVCVPVALLVGGIALLVRLVRGPWDSSPAEVVDGEVRWFSADGQLHTAPAEGSTDSDELVVHYRARRPEHWYPEPVAHDERAGRVSAIVLGAVGAVSAATSTVASLL